MRISLRKAQPKDCRRLWLWRNDKAVRRNSFSNQTVPYKQHKVWFQNKLADKNSEIFIGVVLGEPFGMIRLDFDSSDVKKAMVHVLVKNAARGRGLGGVLLEAACKKAERKGVQKIEAFVLAENKPSLRIFEKSFFKKIKKMKKDGRIAYFLILNCSKQMK